ncbi:magnesium/cobalt transporter CorA [Maribellus sediminis]|uniref:magnesium/cobalt transporter CorA n=1 Tax=Maribellus sediminis TaxID=2696285 RepID=UPI0014312D42|nr:magnesium/cobalt transporter CorA [Maribellus sediminis]
MARFLKDRSKAKGTVPGSLVLIGRQKMENTIIQFIGYTHENLIEEEVKTTESAIEKFDEEGINWINIYGIHDLEMIDKIGQQFDLPALLLEDILNTDQSPKYENGETYDAFILKMLHQEENSNRIHAEQISIILGKNYVLTLQERRGDFFAPVRDRIRKSKGRIRQSGNDYLAYVLMDTILDNYLLLIEKIGAKVEDLEDRLFKAMDNKIVEEIYQYKTELNYLRKAVRPVRDFLVLLNRTEDSYIMEQNKQFLNDLQDLAVQCTDSIELYNNLVSDQLNIYNSNMSNKMNEVMKTLTIFASVFIPLTFVAGIYGMNFEYMPELKFKYSYLILWIIFLVLGGGLFIYFKRKKWL